MQKAPQINGLSFFQQTLPRVHDRIVTPEVTRLVRQYRKAGKVSKRPSAPKHRFSRKFTATDVTLLAEVDARHGTISGVDGARPLGLFDLRFEQLAGISGSHW
jgi:hypothetical protein